MSFALPCRLRGCGWLVRDCVAVGHASGGARRGGDAGDDLHTFRLKSQASSRVPMSARAGLTLRSTGRMLDSRACSIRLG